MAQRVQVAEAYRQAFDPKNETDDWEHHRRIREKGAAKAERDLKGDESIACQDIQYGPPGSGKVVLKASRRRPGETGPRPCIFFVHGGLMTGSNRYVGVNSMLLDWGRDLLGDAVVLSVEYGRPPQSKGLEPSDNCWETLCWAWENREDLGIDPKRLVIYGASAGGCLATSMTLRWMATHEKNEALSKNPSLREFREMADPPFPQLKGVYLEAPMLDDRCRTRSHQQYARGDENVGGNLSSTQLAHAWGWLLDEHATIEGGKPLDVMKKRAGSDDVSILEAPGRSTPAQLSGFPPLCLEVGDADPLRDEGGDFVRSVKESGGGTEAAFTMFGGGVPHGGWAIDAEKRDQTTRDILRARVERLRAWLT